MLQVIRSIFHVNQCKFIFWFLVTILMFSSLYIFLDDLQRNQHVVEDEYEEAVEIRDKICLTNVISKVSRANELCEHSHLVLSRSNRTAAIAKTLREYFTFKDTERIALYLSAFWDKIIISAVFIMIVFSIITVLCGCTIVNGRINNPGYQIPVYSQSDEKKKC